MTALDPEDIPPTLAPSERQPWKPDFASAVPPPADPSPAPTKTEWTSAPLAKEARVTEPWCTVKRIREWVQVECKSVTAIERISGATKDVSFRCVNTTKEDFHWGCDFASVTFPMRRGDRIALQAFRPTKWGPVADSFITGQFLSGDAVPLISVQGIRGGV